MILTFWLGVEQGGGGGSDFHVQMLTLGVG
jgi:hypothetical protein